MNVADLRTGPGTGFAVREATVAEVGRVLVRAASLCVGSIRETAAAEGDITGLQANKRMDVY